MTLFFIEFGAFDPKRFRHAVEAVSPRDTDVSSQVGMNPGNDARIPGGLSEGLNLLFQGQTLCLKIQSRESAVPWLLLFPPNAMDSTIPMWHATLELRANSHRQIFQSLKDAGLQFVAVAKDEPFDLTEDKLAVDQFPWASPNFVAAAIADDKGTYIEAPL